MYLFLSPPAYISVMPSSSKKALESIRWNRTSLGNLGFNPGRSLFFLLDRQEIRLESPLGPSCPEIEGESTPSPLWPLAGAPVGWAHWKPVSKGASDEA